MSDKNAIRSMTAEAGGSLVCPLSCVKAGTAVRIKRLCVATEVAVRLREIGFCEDQIIRLLTGRANIICLVCSARLALSTQLAQAILVEPLPDQLAA